MPMKYSIIIPTLNGLPYIKDCIASILQQDFEDYELVISDNHSDDGTLDYIQSLKDEKIVIVQPHMRLPIAEHWEFAIAKSKGDWVTVVGSDDGLMPYYFTLAEILTQKAQENGINIIGSTRAYYFWDGCQHIYGDTSYSYTATNSYSYKSCHESLLKTLFCKNHQYFSLPHIYTSSIIHKSALQKIRKRQQLKLITAIAPDASLAANLLLTQKQYIHSHIPLGIVGSSPSSNGVKTTQQVKSADFFQFNSKITLHSDLGNINNIINNARFFLFDAVLNSKVYISNKEMFAFLHSSFLKELIFSTLHSELIKDTTVNRERNLQCLDKILKINKIPMEKIEFAQGYPQSCFEYTFNVLATLENSHTKDIMQNSFVQDACIEERHSVTDCPRLIDFWGKVRELNEN